MMKKNQITKMPMKIIKMRKKMTILQNMEEKLIDMKIKIKMRKRKMKIESMI